MIQSLNEVVESLSDPLERYLERMTGNPATAEDLLQETLLKIARGAPRFEGRSSVKTWAFTIATRVAVDHFRRAENRQTVVELDELEMASVDTEAEEAAVVREMNACIRDVIDSLPETYRAALLLHDFEGLTAAETAHALGSSLPTAKIRIHRARGRLNSALRAQCSFYRDRDGILRCDRKSDETESGRQ